MPYSIKNSYGEIIFTLKLSISNKFSRNLFYNLNLEKDGLHFFNLQNYEVILVKYDIHHNIKIEAPASKVIGLFEQRDVCCLYQANRIADSNIYMCFLCCIPVFTFSKIFACFPCCFAWNDFIKT